MRDSSVRGLKKRSQMCPDLFNSIDTSHRPDEGLELSPDERAGLETSLTTPESNRLVMKLALSFREDARIRDLARLSVFHKGGGWNQ